MPHAKPPGKFRDPLLHHPAPTFSASGRPSQCLSRISVPGFLSSPLIVLSKRLKLTPQRVGRSLFGTPGVWSLPCSKILCSAFRLHNPSSHRITPSNPTNHREMDRTIAQTFISALHSFETRILRFRIEHLRASRVVGTWLLARRLPSDIGRSAGDAVVHQVRWRGC
jgi:hypothetical protein